MAECASRRPAAPGAGPDDAGYLLDLLARSPLLPEPSMRRHWQRLVPWLDLAERYALAGILLEAEHALQPPAAAGRGQGQHGRR
jgi:hypothetical protein